MMEEYINNVLRPRIQGDGGEIAIINEGKYGIGANNSEMSLSLLRATIRPDPTSDIGRHHFSYLIYPHAEDFVKAEVPMNTIRR